MADILLEPTKTSLHVDFSETGKLVLAGISISENSREFYNPLIEWAKDFKTDNLDFDLIIEYINTSCAKKLLELLNTFDQNTDIKSRKMNWYFEEWDDDAKETGKVLAESLPNCNFDFITYVKKKS